VLTGDLCSVTVGGLTAWLRTLFPGYRVSLQRKKRCQQIIGLNDESFSVAVCIDAENQSALGEMFGDAVRPAFCV